MLPKLPIYTLSFILPQWLSFVRAHSLDDLLLQQLDANDQTAWGSPQRQTPMRVGIIGAGAGGSAAAWWLRLASERLGQKIEIEVFERSQYIGGRSTVVYPYENRTLMPVELGASIFTTDSNKNMYRATRAFGIDTFDIGDDDSDMGIWDGQKFVISLTGKGVLGQWWDTVKVLLKYGYRSPTVTSALVQNLISSYITLYTTTHGWSTIEELSTMLNFSAITATDTASYLKSQGVTEAFAYEFVEAATRVNYGQDVDKIHGVEGLVSMSPNGAVGALGGNFQIFANFLDRSGARVHLGTTVTALRKEGNGWILDVEDTLDSSDFGTTERFDAVILAAPHGSTNIKFPASTAKVPRIPYVHLHVTLFTTTSSSPSTEYFNLPEGSTIPSMLLTTAQGRRAGGPEPEFNSMNYVQRVSAERDEWVVKIFSERRISDGWLEKVFGKGKVGWVHRHEVDLLFCIECMALILSIQWDAYPVLTPTNEYPPMVLDDDVYYVNGFERFISTMETETVASRGIVDMLLKKKYGQGICPEGIKSDPPRGLEFVWGWEC